MKDQINIGTERLQFDTDGQRVGKMIMTISGLWALWLDRGFIHVRNNITGKPGVWDARRRKLVEFSSRKSRDEQRNET